MFWLVKCIYLLFEIILLVYISYWAFKSANLDQNYKIHSFGNLKEGVSIVWERKSAWQLHSSKIFQQKLEWQKFLGEKIPKTTA